MWNLKQTKQNKNSRLLKKRTGWWLPEVGLGAVGAGKKWVNLFVLFHLNKLNKNLKEN